MRDAYRPTPIFGLHVQLPSCQKCIFILHDLLSDILDMFACFQLETRLSLKQFLKLVWFESSWHESMKYKHYVTTSEDVIVDTGVYKLQIYQPYGILGGHQV